MSATLPNPFYFFKPHISANTFFMSAEEVYNQVAHEYPPFSLDDTDSLFKLFYICMERYAKQEAELTWAACEKYNQLSLEHPGDEHLFPSIPSKDEYLKKYNV